MTDAFAELLTSYALDADSTLSPDVLAAVGGHVLDTIGVALGSLTEPPVRAMLRYAELNEADGPCVLWGRPRRSTVRAAAVTNAAAVRCLDLNDAYNSRDGFHPSDMIPAIVAVGEELRLGGPEVALATAIAYEIGVSIADAAESTGRGWDHVNGLAVGACCGLARLFGLTPAETRNALAITVVPHGAMRITRKGNLTMWKSLAGGMAVRNAIDACQLAQAGVQAPPNPFLGPGGYFDLLTVDGLDWEAVASLVRGRPPSRILETHIKMWPLGQHAQSAVEAAAALHDRLHGEQIESVRVTTYRAASVIMGDPEKWHPKTPETADHSLPYAVATGLREGRIAREFYGPAYLESPELARLLDSIEVIVDPEFTRRFPRQQPSRIEVVTVSGQRLVSEVDNPTGHANNPAGLPAIRAKFDSMTRAVLGDRTNEVADAILSLANYEDIREMTSCLMA